MKHPITMPRWPAWLLLGLAAACAYPAVTETAPARSMEESYAAHGQEPGWSLSIASGWIDYRGNYGEKHIVVRAPEARTTFNGHRFETKRLIVDISHGRCNDGMSGKGFADQVLVIADGEKYRGCGGMPHPEWDM